MVKGMGESSFDDLLPWLMQTLTSESSSVDRSGAAQGKIYLLPIDPFVKDLNQGWLPQATFGGGNLSGCILEGGKLYCSTHTLC